MPVPPKHPHAWVTIDLVRHPALVIEWERVRDSNGYWSWWADCVYVDGGQLKRAKVPATRVRPAVSGPDDDEPATAAAAP